MIIFIEKIPEGNGESLGSLFISLNYTNGTSFTHTLIEFGHIRFWMLSRSIMFCIYAEATIKIVLMIFGVLEKHSMLVVYFEGVGPSIVIIYFCK